jgi:hypothetical protein
VTGWAAAKLVFRTAGGETLRRAAPLFVAVGIVAVILFGGSNGMRASTLTRWMSVSMAGRASLFLAWVAAARGATVAGLGPRSLFYLRTLPVPRGWLIGAHALVALSAQTPWTILWAAGAGPWAAIGATTTAATVALASSARSSAAVATAVGALALAVGGAVLGVHAVAGLAVSIFGCATWLAFRAAPERGATARRAYLGGTPPLALARFHLITLRRRHLAGVGRALVIAAVGGAIAVLATQNNNLSDGDAARLSFGLAGATAAIGAAGLAGFLLLQERAAAWLLDGAGTSTLERSLGLTLAVAVAGALVAALHLGVRGALGRWDAPLDAAGHFGITIGAAALVAVWVRGTLGSRDLEAGGLTSRAAAVAVLAVTGSALLGRWLALALPATAALIAFSTVPRGDPARVHDPERQP